MAAGYCYCLGIKSNNFFLKDNKKAFILWLNVPKVTAYIQAIKMGVRSLKDLGKRWFSVDIVTEHTADDFISRL